MATKKVSYDFYKVETNASIKFESLLEQCSKLPDDESRSCEMDDVPFRLSIIAKWNHCWEGDMTRIRMDQLPVKARIDAAPTSIGLDDEEGIGEETAFLYDPQSKVLVLQRNKFGVSASKFTGFFATKFNIESPILAHLIPKRGMLEKLAKMTEIRSVNVRLASLSNGSAMNGIAVGKEMIALAKWAKAPSIQVTLSVGQEWRSKKLSREHIMDFINSMLREYQSGNATDASLTNLEVSGADNTESSVIDLIHEHIYETREIDIADDRTFPYNKRKMIIRDIYGLRIQEATHHVRAKTD